VPWYFDISELVAKIKAKKLRLYPAVAGLAWFVSGEA